MHAHHMNEVKRTNNIEEEQQCWKMYMKSIGLHAYTQKYLTKRNMYIFRERCKPSYSCITFHALSTFFFCLQATQSNTTLSEMECTFAHGNYSVYNMYCTCAKKSDTIAETMIISKLILNLIMYYHDQIIIMHTQWCWENLNNNFHTTYRICL